CQAEDGIRDFHVTGVQTCALPICCLLEKQVTTPDQYPLSINALTNACNQKSNRDPVLALAEDEVRRTIDTLSRKHLVIERSGFRSEERRVGTEPRSRWGTDQAYEK